jgi:hypothetical protein
VYSISFAELAAHEIKVLNLIGTIVPILGMTYSSGVLVKVKLSLLVVKENIESIS